MESKNLSPAIYPSIVSIHSGNSRKKTAPFVQKELKFSWYPISIIIGFNYWGKILLPTSFDKRIITTSIISDATQTCRTGFAII